MHCTEAWSKPSCLRRFLLGWLRRFALQVSKYVEREILNHKRLIHPHIVQLKEVRSTALLWYSAPQ